MCVYMERGEGGIVQTVQDPVPDVEEQTSASVLAE